MASIKLQTVKNSVLTGATLLNWIGGSARKIPFCDEHSVALGYVSPFLSHLRHIFLPFLRHHVAWCYVDDYSAKYLKVLVDFGCYH